jgi:hypothetical protein
MQIAINLPNDFVALQSSADIEVLSTRSASCRSQKCKAWLLRQVEQSDIYLSPNPIATILDLAGENKAWRP